MASWYLNRALTNWRNAVNAAYPNRDKTSDGTVGDLAHQATNSDHNPDTDGSVDAWDMDVDLRSGRDPQAIEELKKVFEAHPAARYWIHNRQIAHRSTGWKREYYSGASPHDHHVHWNSEPSQENSNLPWVIKEDDLDATQAQMLKDIHTLAKTNASVSWATTNRTDALLSGNPAKYTIDSVARTEENYIAKTLATVVADLTDLKDVVTDLAAQQLPEATIVTDEQLERVLRKVIGSVDGVA